MHVGALGDEHLCRKRPRNAWEGYFFIGIFDGPLRFCKVQLFSGGVRADRHCLSAVEGMDGSVGHRLVLIGREDRVEQHALTIEPLELDATASGFDVAAPTVRWSGPFPSLELSVDQPTLVARTESRDAMWWIRIPRVLSYWSAFGPVELVCGDERVRGLGVVEHAWGTETRLDVARYLPGRWHWDVLAFDDGRWCAALALAAGRNFFGIGSGRVEGERSRRVWGYALRVDEWSESEGRRVPHAWRARMRFWNGTLRYGARAATPVAPVVAEGGFLGFTFEGTFTPRRGSVEAVRGTGFCEYRSRGGHG